jgi:large repetitive protein
MTKTLKNLTLMTLLMISVSKLNAQTVTNVTCSNTGGGSMSVCSAFSHATATITGGSAPYTSTTSGITISGSNITFIPKGTTNIIVKDANGVSVATNVANAMSNCTQMFPTPKVELLSAGETNVTSYGGSNGTINPVIQWVSAESGTPINRNNLPYVSYTVSTALGSSPIIFKQIGQIATGLAAGNYYVSVNDPCSSNPNSPGGGGGKFITITQPSQFPLTATHTLTQPINCTGGGAIVVTAAGGTPPYQYDWNSGVYSGPIYYGSGPAAPGILLAPGSYSIKVKDRLNASFIVSFTITNPSNMVVSTTSTNPICTSSNGTITANVSGGTPPYSYDWHLVPNQNTATATGLSQGSYYVTVTDANGCATNSATKVITKNTAVLPVTISGKKGYKKQNDNNTIEVFINGVKATANNYTFLWSTGATTPSIDLGYKAAPPRGNLSVIQHGGTGGVSTPTITTPPPSTTYTVTVTDANGCKGVGTYTY